jgi:hypothetical protein
MQMFLLGYILISICEIFSVGHFPLSSKVVRAFSSIHIGAVTATAWLLLLNAVIGFQVLEDGTPISMGLCAVSAGMIFIGTGYIALDTGFSFTGFWDSTLDSPNQAYALYTLFLLVPLVFIALFFVLEVFLVVRILAEVRPLRKSLRIPPENHILIKSISMACLGRSLLCPWSNLSIRRISPYMYWHVWQDQRRHVRSAVYDHGRGLHVQVLEQHNRR